MVGNTEDRFSHNEAQIWVDKMGVVEVRVNKLKVDKMGSRQSGITIFQNIVTLSGVYTSPY